MRLVVGPNVVFFILVIMVIEVIVVMTYFNENIVLFIGKERCPEKFVFFYDFVLNYGISLKSTFRK